MMPGGYGNRIYTIFDSTADVTGSSEARWTSMVDAFKVMLQHPLLGVGLRQHGLAFFDQKESWQWTGVHNVYLEIGADLGIPALGIYLVLLWKLFLGVRRLQSGLRDAPGTREIRGLAVGIEAALAGFAVAAMFHPVAYHFYFFYIAGFAVALIEIGRRFTDAVPNNPIRDSRPVLDSTYMPLRSVPLARAGWWRR
jgi:O-antigen ligase